MEEPQRRARRGEEAEEPSRTSREEIEQLAEDISLNMRGYTDMVVPGTLG